MPPTPPTVAPTLAAQIDTLPGDAELAQHDSPEAMRRALNRAADLARLRARVLAGAIVRRETTVKRPEAF
ncbi:MAG: hypothetical protein ACYSWT_17335 [Planctomycetota bacterium]|jgi:hypothetical protein